MAFQLPPIVFVSNASWNYGLPTNRQHLPLRLATHTRVLYSSPFSLSQLFMGRIHVRDYLRTVHEVEPQLYRLDNLQLLPLVRGQVWPLTHFDRWLTTRALVQNARQLGFRHPILWMYYPPSFQHMIGQLDESLSVYHCTDDHVGYAMVMGLNAERIADAEERLVETVDVVFTTSRPLYEKHVRRNPNTYLMPNVADVQRYTPVARGEIVPASDLAHLPHPCVGFIGAIDAYKMDFGLIAEVAHRLPEWSFVFVGPVGQGDGTGVADLPAAVNIHYLGQRPFDVLASYIAGFDVCIIPYRLNAYTSGVFPLKFWEYLAAGKPIVTTSLPSLKDYADCAFSAGNPEEFITALEIAFTSATDPALVQHRVERATGNDWEARAAEMIHVLAAHLDRNRSAT